MKSTPLSETEKGAVPASPARKEGHTSTSSLSTLVRVRVRVRVWC